MEPLAPAPPVALTNHRASDANGILDHKPEGYHKLSKMLMGPYPEIAIVRRFGALNALGLLSMQAELTQLETELMCVSRRDDLSSDASKRNFSSSFRAQLQQPEYDRRQWDLIVQIRTKLQQYNAALLQSANIASLARPKKGNLRVLRDWLEVADNGGHAAFPQGAEFFTWEKRNERDLISLGGTRNEDPFLRCFNSRALTWYHACIGRRCRGRRSENIVDVEAGIVDYDDGGLARLASMLATILSSILPLLAIIVLYSVQQTRTRIWITICLTTVFATVLATLTGAKAQEIFAATAAFAAVEVVFIGSVNSASSCSM